MRHYLLLIAGLVVLDAAFTGTYVAVTGNWDAGIHALSWSALLLLGVNVCGAWVLYHPIARYADGASNDSLAARRRLRRLPAASALWTGAVGMTYALAVFLSGVFAPSGGFAALDSLYVISGVAWFTVIYALYFGYYGYLVGIEAAGETRQRLETAGRPLSLPTQPRIMYRVTLAVFMVAVVPALLLVMDLSYFRPLRMAQGLSVADIVVLDVMATVQAALISGVVYMRVMVRPLTLLTKAIERARRADYALSAPVVSDDELAFLTKRFNEMLQGLRNRERERAAFARYTSPQLAKAIVQGRTDAVGRLPAQIREATALFVDIEGFTALSERISPSHTLELLNTWFQRLDTVAAAHGGTVNALLGDGAVILFNVPEDLPYHGRAALRCALDLVQAAETERFAGGLKLRIRCGIASGPVVAGSVGGDRRLAYTVYGDTVNLASRLEGMNKKLGTSILLAESTARQVMDRIGADEVVLEDLGAHRVPGRQSSVYLHSAKPVLHGDTVAVPMRRREQAGAAVTTPVSLGQVADSV